MLREYEKAKLQMMNNDINVNQVNEDGTESIGKQIVSMNQTGGISKSPYNNFTRATTG